MNAYDYQHGSNWTPARNNIPSYTTGSDREPAVKHMTWTCRIRLLVWTRHEWKHLSWTRSGWNTPPPRRITTTGSRPHWVICGSIGINHAKASRSHGLRLSLRMNSHVTYFINDFPPQSNSMGICDRSNLNSDKVIETKFCTWPGRYVAVAYKNMCCYPVPRDWNG